MSARIAVLVPTRGRPANVAALIEAFDSTNSGLAELVFAIDDDDPTFEETIAVLDQREMNTLIVDERRRLGGTLNEWAPKLAESFDIVGFMGDDHRPRTQGWDAAIAAAMKIHRVETMEGDSWLIGGGIVYGNDLVQGRNLPTAVFIDSRVIRTLGHFVLPGQTHLFMDNYWKRLGEELGLLQYLSDVVIEHVHPVTGKVPWDDHYAANNDRAVWDHDEAIYNTWVADRMAADVAAIKEALHG